MQGWATKRRDPDRPIFVISEFQIFKGSADGPLGEPTLTGERLDTVRGANHERLALAYAKAQDAALLYLRAKPGPCD